MPGSVQNAAPLTVLPQTLCTAFRAAREYPVLINEYRDGETQRTVLTDSSRKSWVQSKRLTAEQTETLRAFVEARRGPLEPFYYYDPYSPASGQAIGSNYDATGVSTVGRYTVRFTGVWAQNAAGPGRINVDIGMNELA